MDLLIDVIKKANKIGSDAYRGLNSFYNKADEALGGKLPYGVPEVQEEKPSTRMAGEVFESGTNEMTDYDKKNPVTEYLKEVPDKGLIPIPTMNPTTEALATAGKYAAGNYGKPFRILSNPETEKQLQKQVEAAKPQNGQLIYQDGDPGYEATKFPSNVQGAGIVGQFIGRPQSDNKVVVNEPYDTNRDVGWHLNKSVEAAKNFDIPNTINSAGNIMFRALGDSGWANKYPRGKKQVIGELPPNHPYYRGGPTSVSGTKK